MPRNIIVAFVLTILILALTTTLTILQRYVAVSIINDLD